MALKGIIQMVLINLLGFSFFDWTQFEWWYTNSLHLPLAFDDIAIDDFRSVPENFGKAI